MSVMLASGYGPYTSGGVAPMATGDVDDKKSGDAFSDSLEKVLGKDAFLHLLTTQLRYQDPMNPVDDQDFIAQMAQFSSLEQMQNLTKVLEAFIAEERATNQMARATALLGRTVEVLGDGDVYTGKVEGIRMQNGVPRLMVGGATFSISDLVKVIAE